ncbi:MAG: hypothetical protein EDX89_08465 [Acidobacteria bacterium]|nr:MAG: hypothetical protein EDX89_08465 [Acidobacteriota bacterium]
MPTEWTTALDLLRDEPGHVMSIDRLAGNLYNRGVLATEIYHAPEILANDLARIGAVDYDPRARSIRLPEPPKTVR